MTTWAGRSTPRRVVVVFTRLMSALRKALDVTDSEWMEMHRIYREMKTGLTAATPEEMEQFSDLFARTLAGKGDQLPAT